MRRFLLKPFIAVLTLIPTIAALGQAGFLDPTFGGTGMVQIGFGGAQDSGQATAVQSDGQLLVAGIRQDTGQIVVMRLGTNNLPDPTFGSEGMAALTPPVNTTHISAVAQQADGKIVVAGTASGSGTYNNDFMLARFNSDGSVDPSFGTGGFVSRDMFNSSDDTCNAMVIQPDGKIVVGGSTVIDPVTTFTTYSMTLARFDTNGNADFSFGSGGVVRPANTISAYALALEGDGNILVGGYASGDGVFRFTTNGILDASFGSGGKAEISAGQIVALAIQPAGIRPGQSAMIVAAGSSGGIAFVARMSTGGVLDTNFNGTGYVTKDMGVDSNVTGLACFVTGFTVRVIKILITGYTDYEAQFMAVRFNGDGSTDTSFGNSGVVLTTIPGASLAQASGLAVQPGPLLVLAGTVWSGAYCGNDFLVTRYNYSNGSLDTNFYGGGILATNLGDRPAEANAVSVQRDGKIVVAGYSINRCGSNLLTLCRLNPDSTFDAAFGSGGKLVTSISPQGSQETPMAIQPDGKIVVAGTAYDGANNSVTVARFLTNGVLDSSFGSGGSVTNVTGTSGSAPNSIALQSDGRIVVAASASVGGNDIAILRYNTNGSPDTTWNGTGKLLTVIGSSGDSMTALAIQSDGKIINSGASSFSSVAKFSMLRCATNGAADNSFGTFGKVATSIPNAASSAAYGMILQPDHKIILAGAEVTGPANQYQLALARYNTNGTLDATFGSGGVATASIGLGISYALAVALQSDGKIVTACRAQNGPYFNFAGARFLTNGVLDSTYGFGGVNYFDYGTGTDENVNGMALDSLGRMVMVGHVGNLFAVMRVGGNATLRFNSITTLANHHIFLTGSGLPSASHTLLKASKASGAFTSFAPVSADSSGNWQYEDTTASGSAAGFYRLSYP